MASSTGLSLIIPTYNMCADLEILLDGLRSQDSAFDEVLVVDDGSHDGTAALLKRFEASWPHLRHLGGKSNQGRFQSRRLGATQARSPSLLFLDARTELPGDFFSRLQQARKISPALICSIRIDETQSLYHLYWKRSHEALFPSSWPRDGEGHWIDFENYHQYVVGTGAMLCQRQDFLAACDLFEGRDLLSDDTALLHAMVRLQPFYRTSDLFVYWSPRRSLPSFLGHLFFTRGPNFVDYHIFEHWGRWSLLFFMGLAAFIGVMASAWISPFLFFGLVSAGTLGVVLSIFLFTRNRGEALRLAPLHLLVILSYGFGALWGIVTVSWRRLRRFSGNGSR